MAELLENADYKPILHSKRANIYYLEKCRVLQKNGRIVYLTETEKKNLYWNIPIANTTVILLGTGTSITQAAVRLLSMAGVMIGFCGGGGTPLFAGNDIEWVSSQSEYRPTEYVQNWLGFWFDTDKRLSIAKEFQRARCEYFEQVWKSDIELEEEGFYLDDEPVQKALSIYKNKINTVGSVGELLAGEAEFTKKLYKYAATNTGLKEFVRRQDVETENDANAFLNHGNYLAYGLASCTLWVLGIPHAFAVMHGKTRKGALVFDVADLVKDAIVLPWSFICAYRSVTEKEFRQTCLQKFLDHKAMDYMFEIVEKCSQFFNEGDAK